MATISSSFSTTPCRVGNVVANSAIPGPSRCCLLSQGLLTDDNKRNLAGKLTFREGTQSATSLSSRKLILQAGASSMAAVYEVAEKSSDYLFRTEGCNPVKVSVQTNLKHYVSIEVSSLQQDCSEGRLVLCWGVYRSDSSSFLSPELDSTSPSGQRTEFETPFTKRSIGTYGVELELESHLAPCYISFVLKYQSSPTSSISVIESHRNTKFNVPVGFFSGHPSPLGLSFSSDNMMNFALISKSAHGVSLCLYKNGSSGQPSLEIELDSYVNRTGGIWHISMYSSDNFSSYGFRCKGPPQRGWTSKVLLDPYAKVIAKGHGLGELCKPPSFDWTGDVRPRLPMEKLILYRLNVKHFTEDKSSKLSSKVAGTFSGVVKKLNHFKDLGVNAILLEPIFPFDKKKGPCYASHFFSVDGLYGPSRDSASAIMSMKDMVKKLHASGIEVYLEVVFTHIADGAALKEIDHLSYYHSHKDLKSKNALNCNHPIVQQFILENLRYWVTEFHIDGFSFVNASYLARGFHGESLSRPPLIEAITFDPVLSDAKLIADCWDPQDLATRNFQYPHWKRWTEMNSSYCYDVRNFLRGKSILSSLATRLCGSGDVFSAERGPSFSFNYFARNSGLPLVDLVSFSRNDLASELSWNCGEEGPTNEKDVLERRLQQIRNFLFILYVSLGVPVLNMGDEAGQTSGGSTAYADRKPYNWSALDTAFGKQMTQFISFLCSLRERRHDLLQKQDFLRVENISWHNTDFSTPGWDDPSAKFLGMTLKPEIKKTKLDAKSSPLKGDLYVAFNADKMSKNVILPSPPEGMGWVRLVDTALPYPGFFSTNGQPVPEELPGSVTYVVKSHSCVLFEAKRVG